MMSVVLMLLAIPLPSSTLFLTREEAMALLSSLEEIPTHSYQFEVAGEFLSGEEVIALLGELREEIRKQEPKKKIPWEREGF